MTVDLTMSRLEEIGSSGRIDQLPELTVHLPLGSSHFSQTALRALEGLLSRCGPEGLVAIETRVRYHLRSWSTWSNLAPIDVPGAPLPVQRLASFHQSGHVREAAVRALVERGDSSDLAYLLLRMNDWVFPVATRARTAVAERIVGPAAVAWIEVLPVLAYLRSTTRRDLRGVLDAADAFLSTPAARDALHRGLREGSRGVRRAALAIVERLSDAEAIPFLREATTDRDPVVAASATRLLGLKLHGDERRLALGPLLASAAPIVRYRALIGICEGDSKEDEPVLRAALFDSAGAVRAFAQGQLRRLGFADVADSYRSRFPAGTARDVATAIDGLSECGGPDDSERIAPFVGERRAVVRVAALRALMRLARDRHISVFADALSDPRARVVRSAHEALVGSAIDVGFERLETLLRAHETPWAARAALQLLMEQDWWSALEIALRALRHPEPTVRVTAAACLERLLRKQSFVRPRDISRLETAIHDSVPALPPRLQGQLEIVLRVARQMR
jgi:HEAT repeat protein